MKKYNTPKFYQPYYKKPSLLRKAFKALTNINWLSLATMLVMGVAIIAVIIWIGPYVLIGLKAIWSGVVMVWRFIQPWLINLMGISIIGLLAVGIPMLCAAQSKDYQDIGGWCVMGAFALFVLGVVVRAL